MVKNPLPMLEVLEPRVDPWIRKIYWSRKWPPASVFLPGKFHGQRSLADSNPWSHKESNTTEHTVIMIVLTLTERSRQIMVSLNSS